MGFVQSQFHPCVCYREDIVLTFYVYNCLMFSHYKETIDAFYVFLKTYFNIEYDGELDKYLNIQMDRPHGGHR